MAKPDSRPVKKTSEGGSCEMKYITGYPVGAAQRSSNLDNGRKEKKRPEWTTHSKGVFRGIKIRVRDNALVFLLHSVKPSLSHLTLSPLV